MYKTFILYFSVVRKEEVWHCGIDVLCLKSSFTCIWSIIFHDIEIFDKVITQNLLLIHFHFIIIISFDVCVLVIHVVDWLSLFLNCLPVLCSIHKVYCFRQGIVSPISDLTQRLLLEERDPPATPQESLYEAPPFDEVRFSNYS